MQARRVEHQHGERGIIPVYATGTVEQPRAYDEADHRTWRTLYARQLDVLRRRAVPELFDGLSTLGIAASSVPRLDEVGARLQRCSGWQLVGVEGLLPDAVFFAHLAARRFPVTWWLRRHEQIDYVSEPDLFHDLFGHVPLLAHPAYAAFTQAFGELGLAACAEGPAALERVGRLYWFTIEFGLVATTAGPRIYGAGIASSHGESIRAVESAEPSRLPFDRERVMETAFRIDRMQDTYFVLQDLDVLASVLRPAAGDA
jgi:phenylalanine-4-hydroxylase